MTQHGPPSELLLLLARPAQLPSQVADSETAIVASYLHACTGTVTGTGAAPENYDSYDDATRLSVQDKGEREQKRQTRPPAATAKDAARDEKDDPPDASDGNGKANAVGEAAQDDGEERA